MVSGTSKMIVVPPRHYCVVENPIVTNAEGEVQFDPSGQVKLWHADLEVSIFFRLRDNLFYSNLPY